MVDINIRYLFHGFLIDIAFAIFFNFMFGLTATEIIPIWGKAEGRPFFFSPENLLMDVFWITFYTGLFSGFFTTLGVWGDLEENKVDFPPWERKSIPLLKYLPKNVLLRAIVFAILAIFLYVPIAGGTLLLLGVDSVPYWNFIVLKVLYGIMVSTSLGFVIRMSALGDCFKFKK